MIIDKYTITKPIGKGVFGDVYLGTKRGSPIKYAFKKLNKAKYLKNPKAFKYLENEISILKDVNHPNIIKIYDVKETLESVYIITEYCNGGTLELYLDKYKKLSEEIVQYIMKQVIEVMKYLSNKKIMHRHICLSNILIIMMMKMIKITII